MNKNIFYVIICLFLYWIITRNLSYLIVKRNCNCKNKETFDNMKYYDKENSPLYSHNVDLPLTTTFSCKNFCGPQSQCAITREQCTSDIDCIGCNPGLKHKTNCELKNVKPFEHSGKLSQSKGLNYSSLTIGSKNEVNEFAEVYPGSLKEKLKRPYDGWNNWIPSFNKGLELYNKKMQLNYEPTYEEQKIEMNYPTTISATGLFYETTPPGANIATNM